MTNFQELLEKINKAKESGNLDLSSEEDLSIAIMNLISLEEHFFFTAEKTDKPEYLDLLNEIREVRRDLMSRMIKKSEGELWCVSKHLLAGTMRIIEVGTKTMNDGKKEDAKKLFDQAFKIYSMFWALRLKMVDISDVKKISDGNLNKNDKEETLNKPWSTEDIVKKLVDCCDEGQ